MRAPWIEKRYRRVNGVKTKEVLYYVYEELSDGSKKVHPCGSVYATASDFRNKLREHGIRKQYGLAVDSKMTLGQAIAVYQNERLKLKSMETNRTTTWATDKLLSFFGEDRMLASLQKSDMAKFRSELLNTHKINGVINVIKFCSAFFSFCMEHGYMIINPAAGCLKKMKEEKVARYLTNDEIEMLFKYANIETLKDLIRIALFTGMREGEILAIRKSWFQKNSLVLPASFAKTDQARTIPIHEALNATFAKYMSADNEVLFEGWGAYRLRQAFKRGLQRARKAGTLKGRIRFHDLRHTFASQYLQSGGTLADLRLILGHASIATTQRYSHFQNHYLETRINSLRYKFLEPVKMAVA